MNSVTAFDALLSGLANAIVAASALSSNLVILRDELKGGIEMFTMRLNLFAPVLAIIIASIEPALAGKVAVPAPIIGAGLPVLAVLGGGYWLLRKLRERR